MATSELVTPEILHAEFAALRSDVRAEFQAFRADMYRAFWIQGASIVAIIGAVVALVKLL
ncbi:MAG: hypothetical protein OXH07_08450 [Chloroflexi bacterium]|nr:hypothetical protein [Chloroflexota bacterium]